MTRSVGEFRQRLKEAKVLLEMLELHLAEAGFRDSQSDVYTARLRLSDAVTSLPESVDNG